MIILLSRLTGWGREEVQALTVEEAEVWLEEAVEVEKMLTRS